MADYSTLAAVKAQLNIAGSLDGTLTDDALIETYITQASQMIDTATRRTFVENIGTLYMDACPPYAYGRTLYFREHDVLSVHEVINGDGYTLTASDYVLKPNNSAPKYAIEFKSGSGRIWQGSSAGREQAITIGCTRGYCTEANRPADITLAATKLAAFLYQNRDNTEQTVRFADGSAEIPASAPSLVLQTVARYTKDMLYA